MIEVNRVQSAKVSCPIVVTDDGIIIEDNPGYTSGHYQFCKSADLKTFQRVQDTKTQGAFTPRHGTVIGLTAKEAKRLKRAFPSR